jgi:hypothetical protein
MSRTERTSYLITGAGAGAKRRLPPAGSVNTPCATRVWKCTLGFSAEPKR